MTPTRRLLARLGLGLALLAGAGDPAEGQPPPTDPAVIGRWSSMASLPYFPVHVHVLPSGQAMMWPGDAGISGDDPRLWDPATGTTTPLARPGYDLFCAGHAFLADGRLFVAGGHIQNDVGLATASIYDPFADLWTPVPDMNAGRWYPTATTLANGDVLVISGNVDTTVGLNRLPQVFDLAAGTWRDLTSAQLSVAYYPYMFLAPNGRVFMAGPSSSTRYLDTSGPGAWSVVADRPAGFWDYGGAALYDGGKVLAVGGGDPPTNRTEVIDLNAATPAWRTVGALAFARRQLNATLLPDGTVLVTGGTSGAGFNNPATPVYEAELWDPATEGWSRLASASVPRLYHSSALLLPDGRVLTTGGNGHPEVEVFEPPYLFKGPRPVIAAPAAVGYGQTFLVTTPDAASIARVTWVRLPSVTHARDMNQRINRLGFTVTGGGLSVTAPSDPRLAPPGHYMLFALNGSGVPSVAPIVQLGGPALTALSPSSAVAGAPGFTLDVTGQGFVDGAVVRWNGADRPTTFVSRNALAAAIPAGDVATPGTALVTVANPTGETSNALPFSVSPPANPVPAIASLSPPGAVAGGTGFTLRVLGSGFVPQSVVRWKGQSRTTTFVNGGEVRAAIPAGDIAKVGTADVTVFNPAPGGGTSNGVPFRIRRR